MVAPKEKFPTKFVPVKYTNEEVDKQFELGLRDAEYAVNYDNEDDNESQQKFNLKQPVHFSQVAHKLGIN